MYIYIYIYIWDIRWYKVKFFVWGGAFSTWTSNSKLAAGMCFTQPSESSQPGDVTWFHRKTHAKLRQLLVGSKGWQQKIPGSIGIFREKNSGWLGPCWFAEFDGCFRGNPLENHKDFMWALVGMSDISKISNADSQVPMLWILCEKRWYPQQQQVVQSVILSGLRPQSYRFFLGDTFKKNARNVHHLCWIHMVFCWTAMLMT